MPDRDESADSTWGPVVGVAVFGIALVVGAASGLLPGIGAMRLRVVDALRRI